MKEREIIIRPSCEADIPHISALIDLVPEALLPVDEETITGWVESGCSLVAVTCDGRIVAHQGLGHWDLEGEHQATELRSAYTHPEWRGMGINTRMKQEMIGVSEKIYPGVPVVGFTEGPSKSRGILTKLGFIEVRLEHVPSEFFTICPQDCAMKNGHSCGCKVYVNMPEKLVEKDDTNEQR